MQLRKDRRDENLQKKRMVGTVQVQADELETTRTSMLGVNQRVSVLFELLGEQEEAVLGLWTLKWEGPLWEAWAPGLGSSGGACGVQGGSTGSGAAGLLPWNCSAFVRLRRACRAGSAQLQAHDPPSPTVACASSWRTCRPWWRA